MPPSASAIWGEVLPLAANVPIRIERHRVMLLFPRAAAPHPGERVGGQAGRGSEQHKRERIVAHPGERIGGQAGLGETGGVSK